MNKVVNLRKDKYDVYIGRGSIFGNKFRIGRDGTREDVIRKYERWFFWEVRKNENFLKEVLELEGKVLGCFCAPEPCHGDVIVEFLEEYKKSSKREVS